MTFAEALRIQLSSRPELRGADRILAIIDGPDSRRRTRILARMERRVRTEMGYSEREKVDWGAAISPLTIILLLKILLAVLQVIFAEEGG